MDKLTFTPQSLQKRTEGQLSPHEASRAQAAKVRAVAQMLGMLGDRSKEVATTAAGYVFASGFAEQSIIETAARRFAAGEVEGQNKAFPPTTAEFATEVRRLEEPTPTERARRAIEITSAMLDAKDKQNPPPSQESKARVDAMVAELKAENRRAEDHKRAERWAEAPEQIMKDLKTLKEKTGSYLSPSLRALLKQTGDLPADEPAEAR